MIKGLGFRVWDVGFMVLGFGFGFGVLGLGSGVQGLRFRGSNGWLRV